MVEHAYGPSRGSIHLTGIRDDGTVQLTVRDAGRWRERKSRPGYGLSLMRSVLDSVRPVDDRHVGHHAKDRVDVMTGLASVSIERMGDIVVAAVSGKIDFSVADVGRQILESSE